MRPPLKTQHEMQAACDLFNKQHPIGMLIRVFPGRICEDPVVAKIVEPGAYVLGGHTSVVQVAGRGCIALTHVRGPHPNQGAA